MKRAVIYIGLTALLFGTMEIALKMGSNQLDSVQLTFLRFLIGGILLIPFAYFERKKIGRSISKKHFLWTFLVGIVGVSISMLCFQLGVERCNAGTAASLICLNPLFTVAIAHMFTDEKIDLYKGFALIIGLIAAVFMISPWEVQEGNTILGIILLLIASGTFGAYTIMGKKTIESVGIYTQTAISFIFGAFVLFVIIIATDRPVVSGVMNNLWIVVYCSIFVTGLGYIFYFLAIKLTDASTGAVAFYIKPAIAPFFAIFFLEESVHWNTVVGIVLLISASFLTFYSSIKKENVGQIQEG